MRFIPTYSTRRGHMHRCRRCPSLYETFRDKKDNCIKVVLTA